MTTLASIIALPFLLWSWFRTGNDEDADLAAGLIGWILVSSAGALITWYIFS